MKTLLSRPGVLIPLLITVFVVLTNTAVTTCHTKPAGILTKSQAHQKQAQQDKALAAAAAYQRWAALVLRAAAHAYEDSATYYATDAPPLPSPAADSSSLTRFWADFFGC